MVNCRIWSLKGMRRQALRLRVFTFRSIQQPIDVDAVDPTDGADGGIALSRS
jgi:hypothetical protein